MLSSVPDTFVILCAIYYCIWWPEWCYDMENCKRILELKDTTKSSILGSWFWGNYLFLLLNNTCSTVRAQVCPTAHIVDECRVLTYWRHLVTLLHTRIMKLSDSVWFIVETTFKFSPSAKCGPVSLKSYDVLTIRLNLSNM